MIATKYLLKCHHLSKERLHCATQLEFVVSVSAILSYLAYMPSEVIFYSAMHMASLLLLALN